MSLLALGVSTVLAQAPPPIVNGEATSDFPQVGMLYYESGRGAGLCSATLIHQQWVMTAAHCVDSMDGNGTTYFMLGTDWQDGLERLTTVTDMYIHPDYTGSGYHDIGLMKLQNTISNVDPMPVNDDAMSSLDIGKDITYVGWGNSDNNGNGSGTKRTVTVQIDALDWYNIYTYDESGEQGNVCSGDSGGAALMPLGDGWELVGVNAFIYVRTGGQAKCDHPEAGAGATRVDKYLDWVGDYVDYTVGSGESDVDTDSDTDSDTDTDTDPEDTDTGWWDDELPARPDEGETLSSGGGCATAPSPALAGWLVPLLAMVRRRRA